MESTKKYFQAIDFVIFGAMLLLSSAIGVFFAYRDRRTQSTDNYYFASKSISPILISMSLSVSFISAITVIGLPVEIYLFGTVFVWMNAAHVIGILAGSIYYIPLLHRLQLKSVYEYFNLRFHPRIRTLTSLMAIWKLILYMGVTIYLPALALSAVTPLQLNWSIALTSIVCTFYTSIGGMKAVIWTDFLQAMIMLAGMLAVFIQTTIVVGGFGPVVEAVERGQRNNIFKFDGDPRIRSTVWTLLLGAGMNNCFKTGCNQVFTQRYLSCGSVKNARIALWLQLFPGVIFSLLAVGNGLLMYTFYEGCDPLSAKLITKPDQTMPKLALEIFQNTPGMAGLFVSAAYSGSLSTISSGVNALAALALMDFILPCFPKMSSNRKVILSKALTIFFGFLVMIIAYLVSLLSANIIQITSSITGSLGGPLFGVFTMGLFMPWINHWGALVGLAGGWLFTGWVAISALFLASFPDTKRKLPLSTDKCPAFNSTVNSVTTALMMEASGEEYTTFASMVSSPAPENGPILHYTLYSISPFYYGILGCTVCIILGHICSLITGFNNPSKADPRLFVPILPFKPFRFGVPELPPEDDSSSLTLEEEKFKKALLHDREGNECSPTAPIWEEIGQNGKT
ncbi:sodium-coupled monocarboxylate transporter 2-like [Styela clava]